MIHFHAASNFLWTITRFVKVWAPSLQSSINPVAYADLWRDDRVPPGVHIFTDFERLLPVERALVRRSHRRIAARPDLYRVVNAADAWVGRYDLLQRLSDAGINDFRAHRLRDVGPDVRFPVFLRWENDHRGSLGRPARSLEELDARVRKHVGRRRLLSRPMVVEMASVRDADGLHRKYSAMKIGDHLVPRHLLFSRHWLTKRPDVVTPELAREERRFVEEFPHAEQVNEAFGIAGMEYGRIDYGFSNGRMQVWEINSNPVILPYKRKIDPLRRPAQNTSAELVVHAFEALLDEPPQGLGIPALGPTDRLWLRGLGPLSRRYDLHRH